ncbi:MAG TPA: peptidoglycan-associated lipoprotein Pal [Desulfomonilia bacterium]|nr:peptidoglycan-associated lipoprotein Pal [Desulfomonilia bacterium]
MRRIVYIAYATMLLCAILILMGCPKKTLEPVTPEVSKTPPPVQTEMPAEQPAMKMDMAGESQGAGASSGKPSMEKDRTAFENTDIYFEFDSFELTPEARKALANKATFLNSHPRIKTRIEGNCDERGTEEYNLALGERRAKAVQDYLVFLGISADRISTVSYGEERPVDPGHNETAWAKNRRAHFGILGE